MRPRTPASVSALLALLLANACTIDGPTAPLPVSPPAPLAGSPQTSTAIPHATPLASDRLEMAPLSVNSTLEWRTLTELDAPSVFRVDVRGTVDVSFNPAWWAPFCAEGGVYSRSFPALCSTASYSFQGKRYGPAGAIDGSLRVALRQLRPDGTLAHVPLFLVQGDSSRVVGWGYGAGPLQVMRLGRDASDDYCGPIGKDPCVRVQRYAYDGFQDVKITTLGPLSIVARERNVGIGDSIRFDLDAGGAALGGAYVWRWVPGDTFPQPKGTGWTSATRVERACEGSPSCALLPPYNLGGRVYISAFTLDGIPWPGPQPVSEIVTVGKKKSTVQIANVKPRLPSESFTSRAGENEVRLTATVSDLSRAAEVRWEVRDASDDAVDSGHPSAPQDGISSSFSIPSPPRAGQRWPREHPGALDRKALAYRVRAYLVDDGDTIWSEPRTIRQAKVDVARQEYIDFAKARVPAREEWGLYSTASFSASELNPGDYDVFLAHRRMLAGLEQVRVLARQEFVDRGASFPGLSLTSAFRNPVHHHVHARASASESSHLYGLAADVRINGQALSAETLFRAYFSIAKKISPSACYEPEKVVRGASGGRLTHSHFDWRDGPCPSRW